MASLAWMLLKLLLLLLILFLNKACSMNFSISHNFTGFHMKGKAVTRNNSLELTSGGTGSGRAFYPNPVQLLDPNRNNRSVAFSTTFVFQIIGIPDESNRISDGMTLMMAPDLGWPDFTPEQGECLAFACYSPDSTNNHMFGVEFDIYTNQYDKRYDHIGIDVNSVNSVRTAEVLNGTLRKNMTLRCWVEYTGEDSNRVMVWLAADGKDRPQVPHINFTLSDKLSQVILPSMYIGFSASSGLHGSMFKVFSWKFSADPSASPAPPTPHRKPILVPLVAAGAGVLVILATLQGFWWWKRRKNRYKRAKRRERQVVAIVSAGSFPKFTYKDLQVATRDFKEPIGEGGSCTVYKGNLSVSGFPVAVKCFKNTVPVEVVEHQFLAELKVISQVKHHSLVALKGWCYENKKVLLVYEYMSQGSLQKVLFSPRGCRLSWSQRYDIVKKVAEGLAYLHEGLERKIVHRDVKAGNILLDDRWNAKVGDFGWAKYLQGTETQTMTSVGTIGYISPELNRYGKATEKTDVYSYGILVLEIVTGQQAASAGPQGENLLYRVKSSARRNGLEEMVDPRVLRAEDFNLDEAMKVLQMGLLCCEPRPSQRPTMRQCCGILNAELNLESVAAMLPRTTIERGEASTSTLEDEEDMVSEFSETESSTYQTTSTTAR